ncbi:MAG: 2OG-Fe(II) oxygenase [Pseudohongiellaceae bacterium]
MKREVAPGQGMIQYTQTLEVGDFVPYFVIDNDGHKLDLQAKAGEHLLLVAMADPDTEALQTALERDAPYRQYFISKSNAGLSAGNLFHDEAVQRLLSPRGERYAAYLLSPNLKIIHIAVADSLDALLAAVPDRQQLQPIPNWLPVTVVPDVVSADLAQRLIAWFDANRGNAFSNSGGYKSRSHLHPPAELAAELDEKLCKSLLPEISKVYYADISHRETYKICCYDSSEAGTFGKHRDTIAPHLHRRYAMTLVLNDNFRSGGVRFPEYADAVLPVPKYSALIFPGSLYHQVTKVRGGRRYVLISFFFTEAEARHKADSERYRFTVRRDLRGLRLRSLMPGPGGD